LQDIIQQLMGICRQYDRCIKIKKYILMSVNIKQQTIEIIIASTIHSNKLIYITKQGWMILKKRMQREILKLISFVNISSVNLIWDTRLLP